MGLLIHQLSKEFNKVADIVFKKQFEVDKLLESEYDDYRKQRMYEDILHNLSFLYVAYQLNDELIFTSYAQWLFELMVYLMPDLTQSRIKEHLIVHFELLEEALGSLIVEEEFKKINVHLHNAIEVVQKATLSKTDSSFAFGKYGIIRKTYLDFLLKEDGKNAIKYLTSIYNMGLTLDEIYVDIIQEVMVEVGNLWHKRIISVDQEHYITSMTQVALSQFYLHIFETKRNGYKFLACSVGSELHEMGIRMLSDLLESRGWDSIYLGAALPKKEILKSIEKHNPELIALSVTMPQHLMLCYEIVKDIRAVNDKIKIAVGGRAFTMTNEVWKHWPIDVSVQDARAFLDWAKEHFRSTV